MKLSIAKERLERGEPLLVTMPMNGGTYPRYSFGDGGEISTEQFDKLHGNLKPLDPPLLPGCHPISYEWRADE